MLFCEKSSASGEKVSPLRGSASVASLESVGFASASVASLERAERGALLNWPSGCAPAALKRRPFRAPSRVQRYIVPLSLSLPPARTSSPPKRRGRAILFRQSRINRDSSALSSGHRPRHLPSPKGATLAQALCADTFERSTSATLFFVFFSFRTGNFKKLLYMI